MGFFDKIGKGIKGVITGILLGIVMLPIGVLMEYCSANQMKYHKYFASAKQVSSPADVKKAGMKVWTQGDYTLEGGPYSNIATSEGSVFQGDYIDYTITKKNVVRKTVQDKDKDGNVTGTHYEYSWTRDSSFNTRSETSSIKVNGFKVPFKSFTTKSGKYFPSKSMAYVYKHSRGIAGDSSSDTMFIQNGSLPSASETLYNNGNAATAKVFSGVIHQPDKKLLFAGVASPSSEALSPMIHSAWLIPAQKLLVGSFGDYTQTMQFLKSDFSTGRNVKFIIGALLFMFGFAGLFGPVIKVLDFIPFLGDLAIGLIYIVLAIVSLILSALFFFLFKFFWIILAIGIAIPIILLIINKVSKKSA